MSVSGLRGRNEYLTHEEKREMRADLVAGMSTDDVARKYRCSSRNVSVWVGVWFDTGTSRRHYKRFAAPIPKPVVVHAMPWVTKAMLTGGRAPIAKVRS